MANATIEAVPSEPNGNDERFHSSTLLSPLPLGGGCDIARSSKVGHRSKSMWIRAAAVVAEAHRIHRMIYACSLSSS